MSGNIRGNMSGNPKFQEGDAQKRTQLQNNR